MNVCSSSFSDRRKRNRKSGAVSHKLIVISAAVILIGSCCVVTSMPNRAYRDRDSQPWPHNPERDDFVWGRQLAQYEPSTLDGGSHRFDLSYIEFDDNGDFWDRRQVGWTVRELEHAAQANNIVLVVYVHGWQNDASDLRGHDVGKFHCLLEHLSEGDVEGNHYFGVYVAWRGKSIPGGDGWFRKGSLLELGSRAIFFIPHELSFYTRKSAATRVAGTPVTEAIFQCVATVRNKTAASNHKSRTILIGHSFGALLLEKALAQAVTAKIISEDPTAGGKFTTPADFVVLLNSAAEAIYAKEMTDMLIRWKPSSPGGPGADEISPKKPLIVSITSDADWATGIMFPFGTRLSAALSTPLERFRRYNWDDRFDENSHNVKQTEYLTHTPGHSDRLITHEAVAVEGSPKSPTNQDEELCNSKMLGSYWRNMHKNLTGPNGEIRFSTMAPDQQETVWELRQIKEDRHLTPYWIIRVPKEIMRDHSDIFNENALSLMGRLFRASNPHDEPGIETSTAPRTAKLTVPSERGLPTPITPPFPAER